MSKASMANFTVNGCWLEEPVIKFASSGDVKGTVSQLKEELGQIVVDLDRSTTYHLKKSQLLKPVGIVRKVLDDIAAHPSTLFATVQSFYTHQTSMLISSLEAALLSALLTETNGEKSKESLQIVAMGGLLHEIGIAQLTFDPFADVKVFNGEQRVEFMQHPISGYNILRNLPGISPEALLIVLQHHEWTNGHGFPYMLKNIYPLAKIVSIVAEFVYRTHTHLAHPGFKADDAISMVCSDTGKFSPELSLTLKKLILGAEKGT
ncbi:MAG: HD domain-containing protein [Bdellovibrionales bacterium]|nr:HD domain-containing protein [Bdellovibrionales bacterium]